RSFKRRRAVSVWMACVSACVVRSAAADEGGASFWFPGTYASFAAAPGTPGLSVPVLYLHAVADAGAGKNFVVGGRVTGGMPSTSDLLLVTPTYVFQGRLLGALATTSLGWGIERMDVSVDATLTGPRGDVVTRNKSDEKTGGTDLYPDAWLTWSRGRNNYMTYITANAPIGAYQSGRLANLGLHHWALDGGGGYPFLDDKKGRELSAALGFTYNFENPDTDYRSGVDSHLDWALSQFLSKSVHVGAVGYFYYQLSGDSGAGAVLGDFK